MSPADRTTSPLAARIRRAYRAASRIIAELGAGADCFAERNAHAAKVRRKRDVLYKLQNQSDIGSADYVLAEQLIHEVHRALAVACEANRTNYLAWLDAESAKAAQAARDARRLAHASGSAS